MDRKINRFPLVDRAVGHLTGTAGRLASLPPPVPPPELLQHAAAGRRWLLLVLASVALGTQGGLQVFQIGLSDLSGRRTILTRCAGLTSRSR